MRRLTVREYIIDEMVARQLRCNDLPAVILDYINGSEFNTEVAEAAAKLFGTSKELWVRLGVNSSEGA